MALPRVDQYQLALQNPKVTFRDLELKAATVETTPMGLPKVISGGFALTYHLTNGSRQWAVRAFHREAHDLEKRYAAISKMTATAGSPHLVTVEYQPDGILVDGSWYPITKMPWLNAMPINRYIESNLSPAVAQRLSTGFTALVDDLTRHGIAHGDLQHGNILVDASGRLLLVDYDGFYVPTLKGMKSNEEGHPNYQHPLRQTQFDSAIDRFSILVITVALEALALKPSLWKHSNGDNLLFKQSDFADPLSSPVFGELISLSAVRTHAERLRDIALGKYEEVPILSDFMAGTFKVTPRPVTARPTPVRPQFQVLEATARATLVSQEGFIVTLVGRITGAYTGRTYRGQPYLFLNFGDYRVGAFTLILWSESLRLFSKLGVDPEGFKGEWVSVTGMISVYRARGGGRNPQPQIVVEMPSEIQVVTERAAKDVLRGKTAAPVAAAKVTPQTASGPAIKRETADTLNRLYRNFPSVPAPTPAPRGTPTRQPTPAPSSRRVSKTRPKQDWGKFWGAFVWTAIIAGGVAYAVWKLFVEPA
jgi:serine/threonine protein kinase